MKIRDLLCDAAIAVAAMVVLLALTSAHAQPAPTPVPTKCGEAGIGYKYGTLTGETVTKTAEEALYMRVGPDGVWKFCTVDDLEKPAQDTSCAVPPLVRWVTDKRECAGYNPGSERQASDSLRMILTQPRAANDGLAVLYCSNGVLSLRLATCTAASRCEGSFSGTDDGGATMWTWSGRLADGARGVASASDGRTRPIECVAGNLSLR